MSWWRPEDWPGGRPDRRRQSLNAAEGSAYLATARAAFSSFLATGDAQNTRVGGVQTSGVGAYAPAKDCACATATRALRAAFFLSLADGGALKIGAGDDQAVGAGACPRGRRWCWGSAATRAALRPFGHRRWGDDDGGTVVVAMGLRGVTGTRVAGDGRWWRAGAWAVQVEGAGFDEC